MLHRRNESPKKFCDNACKFKSYESRQKTRCCAQCGIEYRLNPKLSIRSLNKAIFCSRSCKAINQHGPAEERFWKQVEKTDSCWNWTGHSKAGWHGLFTWNKRQGQAHRYAWERERGPITDGLFVLHRCDNPKCVRVAHLFLGTQLDNMRDMALKGRSRKSNLHNKKAG